MKRCPTCNKTFTDSNLIFCIDDGTPLVPVVDTPDESTLVSPSTQNKPIAPSSTSYEPRDWKTPEYQAPASYSSTGTNQKRKAWPWVVGIVAVILLGMIGLGIAAAVILPSMLRGAANRNGSISRANPERPLPNTNGNPNSNTGNLNAAVPNSNSNDNNSNEESSAPADHDAVLARLTDLENEWTVANINADKQQLNQILADDYVGTTENGEPLGKAEYIQTIQRDTNTQKWEFQDLKLSLKGNRATLSGVVKFQTTAGETSFNFADKFVWRDGRWQATGSEISPIK